MLILAFDTTSEHGGVAIYRDAACLADVPNDAPANNFSVTLFSMSERALADARAQHAMPWLSLRDIEIFAVATGPGSFTGIRVGVAAAQGWAKALNRPVKGISALEAIVEEARPESEWAIPILDALRGEFFLGVFRRAKSHATFEATGEGMILKPNVLQTFLEDRPFGARPGESITCLIRESDRPARALRENFPGSFRWQSVSAHLLGAMARLALRASRDGKLESPAQLDACYIRRPDAEIHAQRVQGPG